MPKKTTKSKNATGAKPKAKTKPKRGRGRPKEDLADKVDFEVIEKYGMMGLIDKEIAWLSGVCLGTIQEWKKDDRFADALGKGKVRADDQVFQALFKRALGGKYTEVTEETVYIDGPKGRGKKKGERTVKVPATLVRTVTKEIPPDTGACALFLKNRRRDRFKDKWPDEYEEPPDPTAANAEMDRLTVPPRAGSPLH